MSENKREVNALTPITKEERQSWISVAFVQAGICVCIPSFLEGALLVEGMNFWPAIFSGIVGYILVVVAMTVLGFIGCDLGLASCTITESTLGKKGSRGIAGLVFAVNLIGWFGINNQECAQSFVNFMQTSFDITIPYAVSCIFWGVVMTITAAVGMKTIEKLDYIAIPLLMIVMIIGTYLAIKQNGLDVINEKITSTMSFLDGVILAFDFYACGVITAADVSRFQKSRKDTVLSTTLGVFPLGVITLVLGALLTKIANEFDISMVLIVVGIPILGVISLVLSAWTTNSINAYCGALDTVQAFNIKDNKRMQVTLVVGILGTILGLTSIVDSIELFLGYLAYLICPLGGIMFADYFIVGKGKAKNWHSREGFYWAGIIAWVVSVVASYLLQLDFLGMIFGAVLFLVLEKFMPSESRPGATTEKLEA
ncbi:MAG TPA: cytosine permease [Anaerovoracaceae bacterium]|nr:cytosine permease [Anaerovoracaceae bacterium]